jgi:CDP-diacylglycerol--glycerol-3-phosphate 3-phosphatidyltransferase
LEQKVFGRPAAFLVRHHVRPNVVTVMGTVAFAGSALTLFPLGYLWPGAVVLGLIATTDALDGTMARLAGMESKWGAFLDSTLDRVADGAMLLGLTIYLALLGETWGVIAGAAAIAAAGLVPYARARAGALGYDASVGIAERTDRLVIALVTALLTGFGLPWWVLAGGLGLITVGSLVTVGQRTAAVHRQWREAAE